MKVYCDLRCVILCCIKMRMKIMKFPFLFFDSGVRTTVSVLRTVCCAVERERHRF